MIENAFMIILKMNCIASVTAMALLTIKFILQKLGFPRKIMFLLWAVIAFRLICPVSINSNLSPFNLTKLFFEEKTAVMQNSETGAYSKISEIPFTENNSMQDSLADTFDIRALLAVVWILGMCSMLGIGFVSYLKLSQRLRFSVKYDKNIYTADSIPTSFVFGIIKPKIYIPSNLDDKLSVHIIEHEKAHIKRMDNITKLIAYVILAVNWFNPINWVLIKLFSNDMELCCDEYVLSKIGFEHKKEYAASLLQNAAIPPKQTIYLCTVAFASNPTKERVKNMIHCKKHSVLVSALAFSICALLSVSFITNATADNKILQYAQQDIKDEDLPAKMPQTVLNQNTKVLQPDKSEVAPSPTIQPKPNTQNKEVLTATPQETQSAENDTITKKQEITNPSDSAKQVSEPSSVVNKSKDEQVNILSANSEYICLFDFNETSRKQSKTFFAAENLKLTISKNSKDVLLSIINKNSGKVIYDEIAKNNSLDSFSLYLEKGCAYCINAVSSSEDNISVYIKAK